MSDKVASMRSVPGYPFLPCKICQGEGFKGEGGCDHTAFERARADGVNIHNPPSKQ